MQSIIDHILAAASGIMRRPEGCLRHPYVVPGGLYAAQLWDWDSLWVIKGLAAAIPHGDRAFREMLVEHATGTVRNFFENQAPNGAIPILIEPSRPDVFQCAKEDGTHNQAKPVLAQLAWEVSRLRDDTQWFAPYFDGLVRFLDRWRTVYGASAGLFVWGSDLAVGVDNDPAIFGRPEFSTAGLLLNCLMAQELAATARLARALGRVREADRYEVEQRALAQVIRRECWDDWDGFFYTVDVQCIDQRGRYVPGDMPRGMDMSWQTLPLKIKTFAGFAPLWAGVASAEQAHVVVARHWLADDRFNAAFGVRTLDRTERMYAPEIESANPSNWLGPVWIIANYFVWAGLSRYGFTAEAASLAAQTMKLLSDDLHASGTFHECYHPDTGRPNFNGGFLSWNALVLEIGCDRAGASPTDRTEMS